MKTDLAALFAIATAAALLSACSGGGSTGVAPGLTQQSAARSVLGTSRAAAASDRGTHDDADDRDDEDDGQDGRGPALTATPTTLTLAAGGSDTFTVSSSSRRALVAVSADAACATVSPAVQKPARGAHAAHTATFTVTGAAGCSTAITVSGGRHKTVTIAVTVDPAPTPAPSPTPVPSATPCTSKLC